VRLYVGFLDEDATNGILLFRPIAHNYPALKMNAPRLTSRGRSEQNPYRETPWNG
jgi:hypothetical protein